MHKVFQYTATNNNGVMRNYCNEILIIEVRQCNFCHSNDKKFVQQKVKMDRRIVAILKRAYDMLSD